MDWRKDTGLINFLSEWPKCVLKFCSEAMKVSLVCVILISHENENFSQLHFHDRFKTILSFKRNFENFKNGSIDYFKTLLNYVRLMVLNIYSKVSLALIHWNLLKFVHEWSPRINPRKRVRNRLLCSPWNYYTTKTAQCVS